MLCVERRMRRTHRRAPSWLVPLSFGASLASVGDADCGAWKGR